MLTQSRDFHFSCNKALETALGRVLGKIDNHRGAIFTSGYEYPGRYSSGGSAFAKPPIEFVSHGRNFSINALNERGIEMLPIFTAALSDQEYLVGGGVTLSGNTVSGQIVPMSENFSEEERLRQPSIFSAVRTLCNTFGSDRDSNLGLYGAFGYDLVHQIEPVVLRHARQANHPDLHVYLPDELVVIDRRLEKAYLHKYDFKFGVCDTVGMSRDGEKTLFQKGATSSALMCDHKEGEYVDKVRKVVEGARTGDYFEVVLSQSLGAGYPGTPRKLFEDIRRMNPSPYEFVINLGHEQLVGASPEMFVQVDGSRVETCPISGTIKRGSTPMEDSKQCIKLLNSEKDERELAIVSDVDRNDKARVCKPGTISLLARRLLEVYSRLIHTVDHVVGELRDECDAFDALLAHMWAGTLTGGPKPVAMQMIEDLENSARRWYGGCVGMLLFNGNMKTGITIRTVHLENGIASVRAGSTLLAYSDPASEEEETRLKASAFIDAVLGKTNAVPVDTSFDFKTGVGKKVLLVDNRDSFVHMLGDYVRQTGAEVVTHRAWKEGIPFELLDVLKPDLVFISPGPGRPAEFKVPELVLKCVCRRIPVFGVCLGLQGIVEAFGGELGVLEIPMHGVASRVNFEDQGILKGLVTKDKKSFLAGRFHSLYAKDDKLPDCLEVLARSDDGIIMAIQHKELPVAAVQFHPESIMTMGDNNVGLRLIAQAIKVLTSKGDVL